MSDGNHENSSMYTLQETKCLCKFELTGTLDDGVAFNGTNLKFLEFFVVVLCQMRLLW